MIIYLFIQINGCTFASLNTHIHIMQTLKLANNQTIKQNMKPSHGGKRINAGRKPAIDKRLHINLYIKTSQIIYWGGAEAIKQVLYDFLDKTR